MKNSFNKSFKGFLSETKTVKIGIFAGAFKPPHAGHFYSAKSAASQNDKLHIFISAPPREMITSEISKAIWDIFSKTIHNMIVAISPISPIRDAYEMVGDLNKETEAKKYSINLYASRDDMPRFNRIEKFSTNLASINKVETTEESNTTKLSASFVRDAIKKQDWKTVASCYPKEVDVDAIIQILKTKISG